MKERAESKLIWNWAGARDEDRSIISLRDFICSRPVLPARRPGSAEAQTSQPLLAPANPAARWSNIAARLMPTSMLIRAYAAAAGAYWREIAAKRQLRNAKRAHGEALSLDDYVLAQPPVYSGPPKPRNPLQPEVPPHRVYVPVVADFLSAAEREFKFAPQLPQSDDQFKRAYASVALGRRPDPRSSRAHLRLRGDRQRQLRRRGRPRIQQARPRHHHRARLQPAPGDQHRRDHCRRRQPLSRAICRPETRDCRSIGNGRWRARSRLCAG